MRPHTIDIDLDAMDRDGIAEAQNLVEDTALTLDGALGTTLDYARIIGIYSSANLSAIAFIIVGTDANGSTQSETIATGPNNGTVVSTKLYKTITSVTPNTTDAVNDVEVGTVATTLSAESQIFPLNHYSGTPATYSVNVTGTINFTVYEAFCPVLSVTPSEVTGWTALSALASKTADTSSAGTLHATAVKIQVNSYSSDAELQMYILQGNSRS